MRRTLTWTLTAVITFALAGAAVAGVRKTPQPVVGAIESGRVDQVNSRVDYLDGQNQVTFRYPGADYVKVHFASVLLLPGDYITVGTPDGGEQYRVTQPGWAMSVTGDTARVALHHTGLLNSLVAQLGVTVDKVSHGFTAAERSELAKQARERKGKEESVCGNNDSLDAVCYETTDPQIFANTKAVARILIGGTELCTAWRIGPNNRMITNHHCIGSQQEGVGTEIWFNYQCAECHGYAVFKPTKVLLGHVLATDETLDYTLFTVDDFAAIEGFGYLTPDVHRPANGDQLYIPQHPGGDPMMVAMSSDADGAGNCAIVDSHYDGYAKDTDASYYCDTAGGSSGSPVISRQTHKVIALHHFGGCPNSGVRMDQIYPEIQNLL